MSWKVYLEVFRVISLRVIIGSISHETNTFSNVKTGLEKFKDRTFFLGEDIFQAFDGKRTIGSAFMKVAEEEGIELVPTIWAGATPQGLVTDEAFDYMLGKIVDGIKTAGDIDGVLLHLHGAMVVESFDDPEGQIFKSIRETAGRKIPLVSTLDLHANISKAMVDEADVLVGYDCYPHTDRYDRGLEAAKIMVDILQDKIIPTMTIEKPPMMPSTQRQKTSYYPMNALLDLAHKMEESERVVNVTVAAGYPFADIEHAGMSMVVTTNNDLELAERKAKKLSALAWRLRRDFLAEVVPVPDAVEEAMNLAEGPVVLADHADNPGGGAPCDGTLILRELIEKNAQNAVVALIADPEAVNKAIEAGIGEVITMKIGGKTDKLHGAPLKVTGEVRIISNGKFVSKGPMGTGMEVDLGRSVVLRSGGVDIIITEKRFQPTTLELYRSFGIEPAEKKIIVVKSAVHFRASHEPIAKKIIEVDAPGIHSARLSAFRYRKLRRPIFPLDPEMLGITELKKSLDD